jgi:hypothetical protein
VVDFLLVAVVLLEVLGKEVWVLVVGVLWMKKRWAWKISVGVSKVVLGVGDELGKCFVVSKDLQLMSWLVEGLVLFLWTRVE